MEPAAGDDPGRTGRRDRIHALEHRIQVQEAAVWASEHLADLIDELSGLAECADGLDHLVTERGLTHHQAQVVLSLPLSAVFPAARRADADLLDGLRAQLDAVAHGLSEPPLPSGDGSTTDDVQPRRRRGHADRGRRAGSDRRRRLTGVLA